MRDKREKREREREISKEEKLLYIIFRNSNLLIRIFNIHLITN